MLLLLSAINQLMCFIHDIEDGIKNILTIKYLHMQIFAGWYLVACVVVSQLVSIDKSQFVDGGMVPTLLCYVYYLFTTCLVFTSFLSRVYHNSST